MTLNQKYQSVLAIWLVGLAGASTVVNAATVQDDFTQAQAGVAWTVSGGACMTAGNGKGTVPACVGNPYYNGQNLVGGSTAKLPDPAGSGALRLTNGVGSNYENGAILSPSPFPSNQGLQVTFTTLTYGGDGFGGHGADGMSFFLADGARKFNDIGSTGGTLGYTCTHSDPSRADGISGGFLGLGIDEYGNYLASTNSGNGFGTAPVPGRIGLRGAGSISWNALNAAYPTLYPSSLTAAQRLLAVESTCTSSTLWNFAAATPFDTKTHVAAYPGIPGGYVVLPPSTPLAAESATTRLAAHPISYSLKLTQDGLLSFSYSYNGGAYVPVLSNTQIASLSADNATIPATFTFGFAGSIGADNNVHEITCFKAGPADAATNSAASSAPQTGQLKTGTQLYLSFAHSDNSWGQMTSQNILYDPVAQTLSIATLANWDGNCVLTGGACATTGVSTTAQAPAARTVLSWNPLTATGIPFEWASLNTPQQAALNAGDSNGATRLAYLRGDRTLDLGTVGNFRKRTGVLGDIMDSSPNWSGPPAAPYPDLWTDLLSTAAPPENSGQTYSAYVSAQASRLNVVFVGANDGMLHGFEAGAYDGQGSGTRGDFGNFVATQNDGKEVIAYVPNAVMPTLHNATNTALDFSSPGYAHNFFVDGPSTTGDLYYGGTWHTWLTGGLGVGGNAIYALDVTNPGTFAEGNAASLVKGEWSNTTLMCANASNCAAHLGQTYGTPLIRRLHGGNWAILYGNGLHSASGHAGLFVTLIGTGGAIGATYFFDTNSGTVTAPSGITTVTPVDLDGDHFTDYVYAGDVTGNVWRFDLTGVAPSTWAVSPSTPLFTAPAGQPIATQVQVASIPNAAGAPRVLIEFGTGMQVPETLTSPATYASGTQALYGIWDTNFTAWNVATGSPYAALVGTGTIALSQLQQQTVTASAVASDGTPTRTVSSNSVCWKGSTPSCNQLGFYLNLPGKGEQVIFNPLETGGAFVVNTIVPANNNPLSCTSATATGWTMALDATSGGALPSSFFTSADATLTGLTGVSGVMLNNTGTGTLVQSAAGTYLANQTADGKGSLVKVNLPGSSSGSRITWVQMR